MTRAWLESSRHGNARDWDRLRDMLSDDFVRLDGRSGVSSPTANGPEDFIASYAAWFDVGFDQFTIEPLAVRGDRLALGRFVFRADDGREVVFLSVSELNEAGRMCRAMHFDEDALTDAVAELDERYLAGEGAPHARLLVVAGAAAAAGEADDFDALRALLSPDFVVTDHRPLGFGAGDGEYLVTSASTNQELGISHVGLNRAVHVSGDALLAVQDAAPGDRGRQRVLLAGVHRDGDRCVGPHHAPGVVRHQRLRRRARPPRRARRHRPPPSPRRERC